MILGAHMSITKGYAHALEQSAFELSANAMQIFLKSPRGGRIKPILDSEVEQYHLNLKKHKIEFVVGHSSYLLNLAKELDPLDDWQVNSLVDDLDKLSKLKAQGLVYHTGKYLKLDYAEAEAKLVENLKRLLDKVAALNVPLLLENCAGQGTEMGTHLSQQQSVIEKVGAGEMLKVCLDTCHAFAAGYDLATTSGVEAYFKEISETIGLSRVVCFHLNDSKFGCGARKDRHANLAQGEIGEAGLRKFIDLAISHNIPLILETPLINDSHLLDIELVRSWRAQA